jgi:hypothetical protein
MKVGDISGSNADNVVDEVRHMNTGKGTVMVLKRHGGVKIMGPLPVQTKKLYIKNIKSRQFELKWRPGIMRFGNRLIYSLAMC